MNRFFAKPFSTVFVALLLAGCAVPGFSDDEVVLECPRLTLLDDAETLSRFATSASQDLSDLAFEARILDSRGDCEFDIDGATGPGSVDLDVTFTFEISPGPANTAGEATFSYFVGVTDRNGTVLNKASFDVRATLAQGGARTRITDEAVHLRIPLKAGEIGADYHLVAGFQLSGAELSYNRRKQIPGR